LGKVPHPIDVARLLYPDGPDGPGALRLGPDLPQLPPDLAGIGHDRDGVGSSLGHGLLLAEALRPCTFIIPDVPIHARFRGRSGLRWGSSPNRSTSGWSFFILFFVSSMGIVQRHYSASSR